MYSVELLCLWDLELLRHLLFIYEYALTIGIGIEEMFHLLCVVSIALN